MKKNLLVVDDESGILDVLDDWFSELEFEVFLAQDAISALQIVESYPIDAIIADYKMPFMSGFDFARKLQEKGHHIPFILISAYADKELLMKFNSIGINNYVGKPIMSFDEITGVVNRALDGNNKKVDRPHDRPVILFADDEDDNHVLVETTLKKTGAKIIHSFDGMEVLNDYKYLTTIEERPDLILLDLKMEGLDGLEACKQIRRWENVNGLNNVPVVALTGIDKEQFYFMCNMEDGFDGYIYKPFLRDNLFSEISGWI